MILVIENYRTKERETLAGRDARLVYRGMRALAVEKFSVAGYSILLSEVSPWFRNMMVEYHDRAIPRPAADFRREVNETCWPFAMTVNIREGDELLALQYLGLKANQVRQIIDAPDRNEVALIHHKICGKPLPPKEKPRACIMHRILTLETGAKLIPMEIVVAMAKERAAKPVPVDPALQMHIAAAMKIANCEVVDVDENGEESYIPALSAVRDELEAAARKADPFNSVTK